MSIYIPANILGLSGQIVNDITLNKEHKTALILCRKDKRWKAIVPNTGKQGVVNRYITGQVNIEVVSPRKLLSIADNDI